MMQAPFVIIQLALATPLPTFFDYSLPGHLSSEALAPGMRVQAPFGKRHLIGILVKVSHQTSIPLNQLKPITAILDSCPIIPLPLQQLAKWAASYYQHNLGEVFASMLPKLIRTGRPLSSLQDKPVTTLGKHHVTLLNEAQAKALKVIQAKQGHQTFLLQGITGSGKTEVYIEAIRKQLDQNRQAMVLVPEIALTPQTVARFLSKLKARILVIHSGLSPRKRALAWIQAWQGEVDVVIGTRSCLFTPLKQLGIIIVDEEHDTSFKQQTRFRYSARDLAIVRAHIEKIPIILGSATPSLESMHQAYLGRYQHLHLPYRAIKQATQPSCYVIDLKKQPMQAGLSPQLIKAMHQHLDAGNQVLLFLNRRGYAPLLLCHQCGWQARCPRCDLPFTLHGKDHEKHLLCHHCNWKQPKKHTRCPNCQADALVAVGMGTEKLQENLSILYPKHRIIRIDRDSTKSKGAFEKKIQTIQKKEAHIILGTQMLAKGHHFPEVTLVAVIDADQGLFSLDFRAEERLAQMLIQVSGRAGRAEKPGVVYIQTHYPNHPALKQLLMEGYTAFAKQALALRNQAKLPPYTAMALLKAESKHASKPFQFLEKVKEAMEIYLPSYIHIEGPIAASIPKKANQYRAQLLFLSPTRQQLKPILQKCKQHIFASKLRLSVRWLLDVDPIEV